MIVVNVSDLDRLYNINKLFNMDELKPAIMNVVEDELHIFAISLHNDNDIPKEYSDSLTSVIIEEMDTVVLTAYSEERWRHKRFGSRLEWSIYKCKKRKYFGGNLKLEYNGPDYLADKWKAYKPVFINNIRNRLLQILGEKQ